MKALALAAPLVLPGWAEAACRMALVLALDVSGSVDEREYALQLGGVAEALADAEVQASLLSVSDAPVALSIFEWSSSTYQRSIQDWVLLRDRGTLAGVRSRLLSWRRERAPEATGLGAALKHATDLLAAGPACWRQTIDVSGDGMNNDWPVPERLRARGELGVATVNALVITPIRGETDGAPAASAEELAAYFRDRVIHGPGAFTEIARGFGDYAEAMKRKLLRELATRPVSDWRPPAAGRQAVLRAADQ